MRARILRGARQVGGSLVELEDRGERVVLDVGAPLEPVAYRDLMPDVDGLWTTGDGSLKGVFITHGHPDHFGLADLVDPAVPIYMGKSAKSLIDEASFFTGRDPGFDCDAFLEDGVTIKVGAFNITPMLVDHSGFDAYGLLVEAGGESIFYTGDIRFHGRKSDRMRFLPNRLPDDLDCLLMEGTNFDRPARSDRFRTEHDLEGYLAGSFRQVEGAAVCFYSAQNIDRLVTLFRAAKRSGRILVLDLYGSTIADATGRETIPQHQWDGIAVYVRRVERSKAIAAGELERINKLMTDRVYPEQIAADPSRYVLTGRRSSISELGEAGCLNGAHGYWCQWSGYLERDSELRRSLDRLGVRMEVAHVSGHATAEDLTGFASEVEAAQTTLIHTTAPDSLAGRVASHQQREDGDWWPVSHQGERERNHG